MSSVHSGTLISTNRTVTPCSRKASQGETLASCSRRVTTISSPGRSSRPIARLTAKVSVVMLGPKTISSADAALRKAAAACRTCPIRASDRSLVTNAPPWFAFIVRQ
jgi:hypothetical protein